MKSQPDVPRYFGIGSLAHCKGNFKNLTDTAQPMRQQQRLVCGHGQNAMASEYQSITGAMILVATIAFWDYFLGWLGYWFAAVERLLHPASMLVIKNGRMLKKNMERELSRDDDLTAQLREQGRR